MKFIRVFLIDYLSGFQWYREHLGGKWCYIRYIYDFGRVMFCVWERKDFGLIGGFRCTLKYETY